MTNKAQKSTKTAENNLNKSFAIVSKPLLLNVVEFLGTLQYSKVAPLLNAMMGDIEKNNVKLNVTEKDKK